jgi:hypothetical protein
MNTAAAEEVLDALAELRALIAECKAMREELRAMAHRSVRPLKPFFRTLLR